MGSFRSLAERESDDSLAELRKADSHCCGPLRYQTEFRHPGQRVCLETIELAFAGEPEIYACVTTQLKRPECSQRLLLNLFRRLWRELRRELFGRHSRGVLALVVVDLVLGYDLPDRQRYFTQNSNSQLATGNESFDHYFIVILGRFLDRRRHIVPLLHQRQSNGGSLLRGFHYYGKPENPFDLLYRDRC